MTLISRLKENRDSNIYPFHMPGHKRMPVDDELLSEICGIDITEIKGFDDLHNPGGIIKEAEERTRKLFAADETHYLVNGSTCGILAAVCGSVSSGDDIIIASNCHRSVYNAAMLSGATLHEITPEYESYFETFGGVEADAVDEALSQVYGGGRVAVVITSPTYEGITSDVAAISDVCRKRGAILIVDAAHGAHFGLSPYFPQSAVAAGADVVVTSVHKTLPAMTQTALIHINEHCASKERIRRMLPVFMTSSPSYVLMASIDSMTKLLKEKKTELFSEYSKRLEDLYKTAEGFECLSLLKKEKLTAKGSADHDKGKIVIRDLTGKLTGPALYDTLFDTYGICAEMATATHVVLMTSVADTEEGFARLADALTKIESGLCSSTIIPKSRKILKKLYDRFIGKKVVTQMMGNMQKSYDNNIMKTVFEDDTETIPVELAEGRTAKDFVSVYPPGIPVTVPGRVISAQAVDTLLEAKKEGLTITGLTDGNITVLWERSST